MSPMFGHVLVSDARKVVVYSLATGRTVNTIHYQRYRRLSREIERGIGEGLTTVKGNVF